MEDVCTNEILNESSSDESDIQNFKPSLNRIFAEKFLLENHFIPTKKAIEYLDILYTYISKGIPTLLEGRTGTSKTISAEMICRYIYEIKGKNQYNKINYDISEEDEKIFIKYDINYETTASDLIKKLFLDKNSKTGFKIIDGPFYKAFKYGIPLILKGIDLVSEEIFTSIEAALDSKEISVEIPKIGLIRQKMKEGFCLIAIKSKNHIVYNSIERKCFSPKFLSYFKIINFHPFDENQMYEFIVELFKYSNPAYYLKNPEIAYFIALVYSKITKSLDVNDGNYRFSIREVITSVKAYIEKNEHQSVLQIYGARLNNKERNAFFKLTDNYEDYIPEEMKSEIFLNKELSRVIESAMTCLNLRKNILITGKKGTGKSMIARWIANIFNINLKKNKNDYYHYICTNETKYSDLIGSYELQKKDDEIYYEWKDGFLIDSLKQGKILILDNLQEVDYKILVRLNSLIDIQYENERYEEPDRTKLNLPANSTTIAKIVRMIGMFE